MDAKTRQRLERVEALLRRPGTEGERQAAAEARMRIYRSAGIPMPPLAAAPQPKEQMIWFKTDADFMEAWKRQQRKREEAEHARRRAAREAEELSKHRERAEAKAKADAAFLRRPGCQKVEEILRRYGHASVSFLASKLGQREHSVRATISRMRAAGAPIKRAAGLYSWGRCSL